MHLKGKRIQVTLAINSVGVIDISRSRVEMLAIVCYNPSKYGCEEAK